LHTLNLGYSFITHREPCNSQPPRCDIAWFHVTNHLFSGIPEKRGINITYCLQEHCNGYCVGITLRIPEISIDHV